MHKSFTELDFGDGTLYKGIYGQLTMEDNLFVFCRGENGANSIKNYIDA